MIWLTGNAQQRESCAKLQHIHLERMDMDSISKYIEGFERYTIDINGNIFDTKREKFVCQWVDTVGYYQCILRDNDDKKKYKRVHRLIAKTFISNPDNLPQVNHKDENKLNNSVNNLEWCTNSENTQHGYDNNLYKFKTRSHAVRATMKNGSFTKTYKSVRSMCEDLHINRKTVTMILKGEKITNNYDYIFEYVGEGQETNESIA